MKNLKFLILIFILTLFITLPLYAIFEEREVGGRISSLCGAGVAFTEDIYSPYVNPAGLIFLNDFSGLFTYYSLFPSLEGMETISYFNLTAGLPLKNVGGLGFGFNSFGYDYYREKIFLLSSGFQLFYRMGLGVNLKLYNVSIKDLGSASSFGIDIGLIAKIYEGFSIGAYANNVNSPKIGENEDEISQYLTLGIEFVPPGATGLSLIADVQKVVDRKLNLKVAQEFRILKYLFLRSGVQSNPTKYSVGLGINFPYGSFDYAISIHNTLGSQHIITLKFTKGIWDTKLIYGEKIAVKEKAPTVKEVEYVGPKININTATIDELTQIPRVGPKTAEKIIKYREEHGPFKTIEDIMNVKGIGPKTFAKIKHMITVGGPEEKKEEAKPVEIQKMAFDLNTAQMNDFIDKGIPPIIALKIIQYRNKQGVIKNVEELKNIDGMTPEIFEKIKNLVEGK
jgi:comEA protein